MSSTMVIPASLLQLIPVATCVEISYNQKKEENEAVFGDDWDESRHRIQGWP
jgi:hypothetical protein